MTDHDHTTMHDRAMPLLDHLIELRRRLLWSLGTFVVAFFFCYHYAETIYFFLARPLETVMAQKGEALHLIYTALPEAFFHLRAGRCIWRVVSLIPDDCSAGMDIYRAGPVS